MEDRYSILRPLTTNEQQFFAIQLCNFFSPLNHTKNCKILELEPNEKSIKPFSFGDFLKYLKKEKNIDGHRYIRHLQIILNEFVKNALFEDAGNSNKGSATYNKCYYSMYELTNKQKTNLFWLGNVLGERFLMEKYKPFIVRFEGVYKNGVSGTGSGILINKNTVLTCRHNLIDLSEYNCYLENDILSISEHSFHHLHDIGIVKLKTEINMDYFPYFGVPYVLDETLTMGYPPLRGMREAALISQKGEINATSKDWQNCDCITISSTVRPGNSGGPVISKNGYLVGIVTQYANSASSVSVDKKEFKDDPSIPFYNAISSTSIIKILNELDSTIVIPFEDYQ